LKECLSLVVTDYNMPLVKGDKVIEHIRHHGGCMPIILATGNDWQEVFATVSEQENVVVISKPFNILALKGFIKTSLTRMNAQETANPESETAAPSIKSL
jgi:DNA-binding response OmpR family regulator